MYQYKTFKGSNMAKNDQKLGQTTNFQPIVHAKPVQINSQANLKGKCPPNFPTVQGRRNFVHLFEFLHGTFNRKYAKMQSSETARDDRRNQH